MVLTDDAGPYLFVISAKQLAIYPQTPSRKEGRKKKTSKLTERSECLLFLFSCGEVTGRQPNLEG